MKTHKSSLLLVSLLLVECTRAKLWGLLSNEEMNSEELREEARRAKNAEIMRHEADEESDVQPKRKKLKDTPKYRVSPGAHTFVKPFHPIDLKDYSYHVVFSSKTNRAPLCQGALIKPRWVLGSAACFEKYKEFISSFKIEALLGATSFVKNDENVTRVNVVEVCNYPDFDYETGINDLALIKLENPVKETEFVKPIYLTFDSYPLDRSCKYTTYVGNILYALTVTFVDQEECVKPFQVSSNVTLPFFCARIKDSQLITAREDILGSPVVCDNQLFGVKAEYSVFSSIYNVTEWIYSIVQSDDENSDSEPKGDDRRKHESVEDSSRDRQMSAPSAAQHKPRKPSKHQAHSSPAESGGDSSEVSSVESQTSAPTTPAATEEQKRHEPKKRKHKSKKKGCKTSPKSSVSSESSPSHEKSGENKSEDNFSSEDHRHQF